MLSSHFTACPTTQLLSKTRQLLDLRACICVVMLASQAHDLGRRRHEYCFGLACDHTHEYWKVIHHLSCHWLDLAELQCHGLLCHQKCDLPHRHSPPHRPTSPCLYLCEKHRFIKANQALLAIQITCQQGEQDNTTK